MGRAAGGAGRVGVLVICVHCERDDGDWCDHGPRLNVLQKFADDLSLPCRYSPSMTNDLNVSLFKSSILNSLMAGTLCLLADWVKKEPHISRGLHCNQQVAVDPMGLEYRGFCCHTI